MDQKTLFEIKKFEAKSLKENPSNKKLPISVFFSNCKKTPDLKSAIKHLPKNSAIIIREYHLNTENRENLARKIIALAKPLKLKVLIGKDLKLAQKLKADGVHFSDFGKLPIINKRSFSKKFILSFSSHSLKSALKAQKSDFDMIFISPVFSTTSHPDAKNIGLRKLTENLTKISLKTKSHSYCTASFYALGGINSQNLSSIRKANLAGFGAISLFLNNNENHSCNSIWRFWHKIVAAFSKFES